MLNGVKIDIKIKLELASVSLKLFHFMIVKSRLKTDSLRDIVNIVFSKYIILMKPSLHMQEKSTSKVQTSQPGSF